MKLLPSMFKIASALAFSSTSHLTARAFSVFSVSHSKAVVGHSIFRSSSSSSSSSRITADRSRAATATTRAMSTTTEPAVSTTTSATATADNNPLLQQEDLPKFASIDPSHVTPAVQTLLAQLEADLAQLERDLQQQQQQQPPSEPNTTNTNNKVTVQYNQVVPVVERMQFPLGYAWGVAGHLNSVKNGEALRQAYEANQPAIVQTFSKFSQSKPLFDALSAIAESPELQMPSTSSTGPEVEEGGREDTDDFTLKQRRRAVEKSLLAMKLGGVGLEGADKERFNEIKMRLASLGTTFSNNVLDETKAFSLTVTDPAQLEGVPDSAKAMWANAHVQVNKDKDNGNDSPITMDPNAGPWRITLDMPSYVAVLSHVPDRALRQQVYMANIQRASEIRDDKNNVPLIYEILQLRHEMAQLLGFSNYAELSLSKKMAPSIEAVSELSDLILEKALPAAEKELEEIFALAKEKGGPEYQNMDKLMPWDTTFWSERLKESKFELTEEETRPYFALPAVLDGMFTLFDRIFNIKVQAADGEAEVWNKDVRFFKIFDGDSQKHIASFFLDPYSRPADKRGGAWMDTCINKSEACQRDVPVAYLTCNGSPPVGDKPSLMTFREVETLFHEAGHGIQHMLTKCTVGDVAGINGVEWDAVELPSQFMENWCYDKATVYGFARHWETGEVMPEEMFAKLCEQKTFNAGMMACRQLQFGQLDMELHSKFDARQAGQEGSETIFDVQRRVAEKYTPYNMPLPEDRFLCAFSHIFAGGYAAGYYSYKWAEVLSADAFSAFEEVGLDNEEEVKKVGRRFRDTVLSMGGGESPMTVFKLFRGREPSPAALLRHNGFA